MRQAKTIDVMRDLLDHELVDSEGMSCGMVDDVQLSVTKDGLAATALWVGPGAWQRRLPALLRIAARTLFGARRRRIDLAEVADIAEVIHLKSSAAALRLARWEHK